MDFTLHVHTDATNLQDLGTCINNYILHNNYLQNKNQIASYNLHNYLIKLWKIQLKVINKGQLLQIVLYSDRQSKYS